VKNPGEGGGSGGNLGNIVLLPRNSSPNMGTDEGRYGSKGGGSESIWRGTKFQTLGKSVEDSTRNTRVYCGGWGTGNGVKKAGRSSKKIEKGDQRFWIGRRDGS